MPQINELTTRTFDGDSLIGFDVENTDPQTQAQYPYVTGKADGNALADFIANEQEYVTDLDTVDKHINGAINELHAINGYSYDAYDETATYTVGDLCIYNNALYKCTTAITTAEAWNASHWTATSIADEISRIDTVLSNRPILLVATANATLAANATTVVTYNFTVPTGYTIVSAYEDSYYAGLVATPIRINRGSGSKTVEFNYFATIAQTHTYTARALALPNVDIRT